MSYNCYVGFSDIRTQAITAIKEGRIQHEARNLVDEKNLFLTGELSAEQVIKLLGACKGTQYSTSPHHAVKGIDVHIFKPEHALNKGEPREKWYLKIYLLDPDVWFISAHKSEGKKTL